MTRSSKELLGRMRDGLEAIEKVLRDDNLRAKTQIADVNMLCWAIVELAFRLQQSIGDELRDLE